jgi:hypothetical protein
MIKLKVEKIGNLIIRLYKLKKGGYDYNIYRKNHLIHSGMFGSTYATNKQEAIIKVKDIININGW